jgi:AcrR family transcriptional regulator
MEDMGKKATAAATTRSRKATAKARQMQIIQAAMQCFQRKGYENTTIDDIAAEYGLSKGSIYWYYSSKKDILLAVFNHMISQLFAEYMSLVSSHISPRQKLVQMVHLMAQMLLRNYESYRPFMVLMSVAYEDDELRNMSAGLYEQAEQLMAEILRQGEKAGEFMAPNKRLTTSLMIATAEGLFVRQILLNDLDLEEIEREAENIIELFLPSVNKTEE